MKKFTLILAATLFALGSAALVGCSEHDHDENGEHIESEAGQDAEGHQGQGEGNGNGEGTGGGNGQGNQNEGGAISTVLYQCPSDCGEGEAFWEPGTCDVCGAEMVPVD